MKKILILGLLCASLLLSGCKSYWDYGTIVTSIDNEYFKTKVIKNDSECTIIQNEITGEYFILIYGIYGVSLCPIEVNEIEGD